MEICLNMFIFLRTFVFSHTVILYNKEKAEVFDKFFLSVFTRENTENVREMPDRQFESILDNTTISPEEVLKKLYNLNPSKAAGPDLLDFLCEPLARFFNR